MEKNASVKISFWFRFCSLLVIAISFIVLMYLYSPYRQTPFSIWKTFYADDLLNILCALCCIAALFYALQACFQRSLSNFLINQIRAFSFSFISCFLYALLDFFYPLFNRVTLDIFDFFCIFADFMLGGSRFRVYSSAK